MRAKVVFFVAVAGGFVLGVAFAAGGWWFRGSGVDSAAAANVPSEQGTEGLLPVTQPTNPSIRRTAVVDVAAHASPAVVSITTEVPNQSPFRAFYELPNVTTEGSGTVIQPDGVVLTNAHVVDGAVRINATFSDGTSYVAQVLGLDDDLDLAVLRLEGASNVPVIPLGTSSDLLLGETVVAIGNPFGLGFTVTTGVVSSPSRTLEVGERAYQDYIQTDAGINPGNSGGPLLDIQGLLVGINSAIRKDAENIGFAIPIDRAAKVARDLLRYGSVQAPWLGIAVDDVGGPRYEGTPIAEGAVVVRSVYPEGGARAVGIQEGDVILKVDGKPVHSRDDLNLRLATLKPGDTVHVEGVRKESTFQADIVANALPEDAAQHMVGDVLGVKVEGTTGTSGRGRNARAANGVVVTSASSGGTFVKAGLRQGDIVLGVNGEAVHSGEDFGTALARARSAHRSSVLLRVQRGPYAGNVEVEL
jgi:serine protease Do